MRILLVVVVLAGLGYFACRSNKEEPKQVPAPVERPAGEPKAIPQKEATEGAAFNKLFPAPADGYKVVFTQEKDGFAQADLTHDGKKVAVMTISDTAANPSARDKFKSSSKQIAGHPAAAVGSQGTALLVGDRYQVQVRSLDPSFAPAAREAWLEKFKLTQLAALASKR